MTKPKFFASSITVLIGTFINLENIVFSSYLLVKIDDSSVDSKTETSESFGPITKDLISRSGASRAITKGKLNINQSYWKTLTSLKLSLVTGIQNNFHNSLFYPSKTQ